MVYQLVNDKQHLNWEGWNQIVGITVVSNTGLNKDLKNCLPCMIPIERPTEDLTESPHPEWFAGFASAESSFYVGVGYSKSNQSKCNVTLRFSLTQHFRDEKLINSIQNYFGCGAVYKNRNVIEFMVNRLSDYMTTIIPFFLKYLIRVGKSQDFKAWCLVGKIILQGKH